MFGVDSMSTRDILSYFDGYAPSWVEWINDSSCNVVFEDDGAAKHVLYQFSLPAEGGERLPVSDVATFREALPFTKHNGTILPLQLRIATEADVRPDRPNPNSQWARSIQRKKQQQGQPRKARRSHNAQNFFAASENATKVGGKRSRSMDMEYEEDDGGAEVEEEEEAAADRSKRRRHSEGSDQIVAKMFAKDLRSILGNRGKGEGEDVTEMATEQTGTSGEGTQGQEASMETDNNTAAEGGESTCTEAEPMADV